MKKFKNKKIMLSFLIIFVIGLAFGIYFIFYINESDKIILTKEIEEYISLINNNKFDYLNGFLNSLKINLTYVSFVWGSGILFIFFPITYFIIFYKGFLTGFIISSFIYLYKVKGVLLSIVFMFPHEIINIIILFMLSIISVKFSKKLFQKIKSNELINLKELSKRYLITYVVFIGFTIISSLLEVFINSFLIKIML